MKEIEKVCITCKYFTILCGDDGIGECEFHDPSFFVLGGERTDKVLVRSDETCIYWDYFVENSDHDNKA